MISRYRKYRAALGIAVAPQIALLPSLYYWNCGSAMLGVCTICERRTPPIVAPLLGGLYAAALWLSVPALVLKSIIDELLFMLRLDASRWVWFLLDWGPMLYASAVNVLISTMVLGSIFVELERARNIYRSLTREKRPSRS